MKRTLSRQLGTTLGASALLASSALAQGAQGPHGSPFSPARLTARSDSFAIMVQGTPRGFMKESLERTADGFRLVSAQALGTMMSQNTEVTFSPTLEMRAVKQTGQARGQEMKIDVAYARGRAKGSATTPGPQGMQTVAVDAALPGGAVDDNALMALLPSLPLTAGASWKVPVFASGKGTTSEMTLTVGSAESVNVVAGTFEAWPVQVTGGPIPITFYVSTGDRPRVVRLTMTGSPMSFELASK